MWSALRGCPYVQADPLVHIARPGLLGWGSGEGEALRLGLSQFQQVGSSVVPVPFCRPSEPAVVLGRSPCQFFRDGANAVRQAFLDHPWQHFAKHRSCECSKVCAIVEAPDCSLSLFCFPFGCVLGAAGRGRPRLGLSGSSWVTVSMGSFMLVSAWFVCLHYL